MILPELRFRFSFVRNKRQYKKSSSESNLLSLLPFFMLLFEECLLKTTIYYIQFHRSFGVSARAYFYCSHEVLWFYFNN